MAKSKPAKKEPTPRPLHDTWEFNELCTAVDGVVGDLKYWEADYKELQIVRLARALGLVTKKVQELRRWQADHKKK